MSEKEGKETKSHMGDEKQYRAPRGERGEEGGGRWELLN